MATGLTSRHRTHALLVLGMQRGYDDPLWGERDNPDCEHNIHRLLNAWRAADQPIVVARLDDENPASPLHPGAPGNVLRPGVDGPRDLLLVLTSGRSAFHGAPDLHRWCGRRGITTLTVCGAPTDQGCDTTVRLATLLGYRVHLVGDATHAFTRRTPDGATLAASSIRQATLASVQGDYAEVRTTAESLADISPPTRRRRVATSPTPHSEARSPIR